MTIVSKIHEFRTRGEIDIIDLSQEVRSFVRDSSIKEGKITIFCIGSTGSIASVEYEYGLLEDYRMLLQKLIPRDDGYHHDRIDNNAHSHLRSTLLGSEITIPIVNAQLVLGTWQQVVFVEFDVHQRSRKVVFQALGIQSS
ncbi:MAG: YjbQ family protein [Candidatus Heimdallarchaeota archaeon]|nr:YjbQ family protein [Candidatus Heimdallarchaeota archaeon]